MPVSALPCESTRRTSAEPPRDSVPLEPSIPLALDLDPLAPLKYEDLLLSRRQTAKWLLVTVDSLSAWDRKGLGPRPIRIGPHKTAYKISSILEWLDSQAGVPARPRPRGRKATLRTA